MSATLPYSSKEQIIAAFNAGVRFKVVRPTSTRMVERISEYPGGAFRVKVKDLTLAYSQFNPNGTHQRSEDLRLEFDLDYPALPFSSADELVEAFKAGTKFTVIYRGKHYPAQNIVKAVRDDFVVFTHSGGNWTGFNPDGSSKYTSPHVDGTKAPVRLVVNGEVKRPSGLTQSQSVFVTEEEAQAMQAAKSSGASTHAYKSPFAAEPRPVAAKTPKEMLEPPKPQPFLQRYFAGVAFHNPKTREVVHSVDVSGTQMVVTLRNPDTGTLRTTPRYNLNGTHKFRAERNLVEGKPPKAPAKKRVKIYKHATNGTLFVIREGEVLPNIKGISNATVVGSTTITE